MTTDGQCLPGLFHPGSWYIAMHASVCLSVHLPGYQKPFYDNGVLVVHKGVLPAVHYKTYSALILQVGVPCSCRAYVTYTIPGFMHVITIYM